MKIIVETNININEVSEAFVLSGSDEQAAFFNNVGKAFKDCGFNDELQCCYIVDDIDKNGKNFIFTLANFLKARGLKNYSKSDTMLKIYDED